MKKMVWFTISNILIVIREMEVITRKYEKNRSQEIVRTPIMK